MIGVDSCLSDQSDGGAVRGALRLNGRRLVQGLPRLLPAPRLVGLPPALLPIDEQLAAGRIHAKRLTSDRPALQSP